MADNVVPFARPKPRTPERTRRAPLLREALGEVLREERHRQARTLKDVAKDAGVSTPYLSEIERGRKEPSSEFVAAVGDALGLRLVDVVSRVERRLGGYDAVLLAA